MDWAKRSSHSVGLMMNFKLMVCEAQNRHQTHGDVKSIYECNQADFIAWKSREGEKQTFKDPKNGIPVDDNLTNNWVLFKWITVV
jgi:hypothetical protein